MSSAELLAVGVLAGCAVMAGAVDLAGQRHAATDAALAASLLAAVPLPVSAAASWPDTLRVHSTTRGEVQYSRAARGDPGASVILGIRWDSPSSENGWMAFVSGVRAAVSRDADGEPGPAALEVVLGGRSLGYLERRWRPDWGLELVVGLSRLQEPSSDFVLGLRAPTEWVVPAGPGRLLFSIVPAMAWGDFRFRHCVDMGGGDGCNPHLDLQLEAGRTRFLVGGGVGYALPPTGLSVSAGVTRLLARGQEPRLALGVAWGY